MSKFDGSVSERAVNPLCALSIVVKSVGLAQVFLVIAHVADLDYALAHIAFLLLYFEF